MASSVTREACACWMQLVVFAHSKWPWQEQDGSVAAVGDGALLPADHAALMADTCAATDNSVTLDRETLGSGMAAVQPVRHHTARPSALHQSDLEPWHECSVVTARMRRCTSYQQPGHHCASVAGVTQHAASRPLGHHRLRLRMGMQW